MDQSWLMSLLITVAVDGQSERNSTNASAVAVTRASLTKAAGSGVIRLSEYAFGGKNPRGSDVSGVFGPDPSPNPESRSTRRTVRV